MTEIKNDEKPALTSRQKKYLKGLAHDLPALVQVGKEGLSESLIEAADVELERRELIKVKLGKNSGVEKDLGGEQLAKATDSYLVQIIGKTLILYRANPKRKKDERIKLPKA
ncbi:ribosome assembly RNA-binding protein YhbY [Desulfosediminicola sp.]|uniref:ribosome assembly RNA-binding protein YhbY n=1 Tax=Desulfosediminicola sp. TaxID=2886825 RepID=UPI003AF2EF86